MRCCSTGSRQGALLDVFVVLLLWGFWLAFVWRLTAGRRVVLWDTFRDMAWAENIRAGRIWSDPTHPGSSWWYPPGSALLNAILSHLTGWAVADLYGYSAMWLNGWLPVLLYLAVRQAADRTIALVTLGTVLIGSFTWLTHAAAAIPSFQGMAFNLLGLMCWQRCWRPGETHRGARPAWLLLTGLVLATGAWFHPLCASLLAGAILFHALLAGKPGQVLKTPRPRGQPIWTGALSIIGLGLLLSAPLAWHLLRLHTQSPELARFFADELLDPAYYAQASTPLVVPAGLAGVWIIVARRTELLWTVGYLLIGLLGLAVGYFAQRPGCELPFLLPHEFLWHAQLGLGICAAVAIVEAARRWASHASEPARCRQRYPLILAALVTATVAPGLRGSSQAGKYLIDLEPLLAHTTELRAWIGANAGLDDVFVCAPDVGYCVIAGLTGRKCVAVSPGHSNPALDIRARHDDVRTMLDTDRPEVLEELARRYGARYLALVTQPGDPRPVIPHRCASRPVLQTVFRARDGSAVVYRLNCYQATQP
mgnify:CR=1 FL=1